MMKEWWMDDEWMMNGWWKHVTNGFLGGWMKGWMNEWMINGWCMNDKLMMKECMMDW